MMVWKRLQSTRPNGQPTAAQQSRETLRPREKRKRYVVALVEVVDQQTKGLDPVRVLTYITQHSHHTRTPAYVAGASKNERHRKAGSC